MRSKDHDQYVVSKLLIFINSKAIKKWQASGETYNEALITKFKGYQYENKMGQIRYRRKKVYLSNKRWIEWYDNSPR